MSEQISNEAVAAVLEKAHDELLVRGWCRGDYESDDGRVCAIGALKVATGSKFCASPVALEAERQMAKIIDPNCCGTCSVTSDGGVWRVVPYFNDMQARSIDDVLELFRRAGKKVMEDAG